MPQPSLEELAAAYQAQQAGQGQNKREKKKTLTETVNESFRKYIVNPVVAVPKYAAKGVNYAERFSSSFIRTAVPLSYATVATLPMIALNPLGAAIVGLSVLAISYITTNTAYKLIRDSIYFPKTLYGKMKAKGGSIFKNPLKKLGAITGGILTAPFTMPFKVFKAAISYPLTSAKRYGPEDQNGKRKIIGGESKLGHRLGLLAGPAAGFYMASGLTGLSGIASSIKDYFSSNGSTYYNTAKSYLPNLRFV